MGKGHEGAESAANWRRCKKNPGHEKFISVQDFIDNHLSRFDTDEEREVLKARIDLTVKLRVTWTSVNRPDEDGFSAVRGTGLTRTGTGFIRYVGDPVSDKPCPCSDCDGQTKRKYWPFNVRTVHHVVYDKEEASKTKIDLFFHDESCQTDGRMKTLTALEHGWATCKKDFCDLFCVTHDGTVGERIESARRCLMKGELNVMGLLPLGNRDPDTVLIVSHPHGQPKTVTMGERKECKERANIEYNTATCPGSSGAPVFLFDSNLKNLPHLPWYNPAHSGSYTMTTPEATVQLNFGYLW